VANRDTADGTPLLRRVDLEPLPAPLWTLVLQRTAFATAAILVVGVTAMFLLLSILPRTGSYATFSVMTGSMEPGIRTGSVVIVIPEDPSRIQVGDIITVTSDRPPYATVTHRVTRVVPTAHGPEFKTKGDGNLLEDPWQFGFNGPAGRVAVILPWLGYALAFARTVWARLALAGCIGLVMVGFFMPTIWRSRHPQPDTECFPHSAPLPLRRAKGS
jgi:signal peptidase I